MTEHFASRIHMQTLNTERQRENQQPMQLLIDSRSEANVPDNCCDDGMGPDDYCDDDNDMMFNMELEINEFEDEVSAIPITEESQPATAKKPFSYQHWLHGNFAHLPTATRFEVMDSFGDQRNMKLYHFAEFVRKNGGIQYLVTRSFRRTEFIYGSAQDTVASVEEAKWHFKCFTQYISMSDKQRQREAELLSSLLVGMDQKFFRATRLVSYHELNIIYGRSNQHSLWNVLPVPSVANIGGIAYVNPVNAIRYLMAFSAELDDLTVKFGANNDDDTSIHSESDESSGVYHIAQSEAVLEWKKEVLECQKDEMFLERHKVAILAWAVDWRDGFGSNRTKQNRKSTNAWTFSFSTPKEVVNSISNTLPIAIGLKKNASWPTVEEQFRLDMRELSEGRRPVFVYHGGLRKTIPVFVRRIACLTDKVERADYTSTLSCTSTYHRYFSKICRFDPPTFQIDPIEDKVANDKGGINDNVLRVYGWSCNFVDRSTNGGRFPACYSCRKRNVDLIRNIGICQDAVNNHQCEVCANWTLDQTTKEMLSFTVPKDYPTRTLPDCPIDPPEGREVGVETLSYIDLEFLTMVKAAKFAFFHCKSKRGTGWNKVHCQAYLRTCGINGRHQDLIYAAAVKAYADEEDNDYNLQTSIGSYKFPASWNGDIALKLFIEMIMHLLFLGVAESNFVLCNMFMKSIGKGVETFKKCIQHLLKLLTKFNLSWLLALPFSGATNTKLTTGTWVSENWLAWVRLSKVAYGYFCKNGIDDHRLGCLDLLRMVTSFTALVARILSHSGASEQSIQHIEMLVKEFLSTVRELDVRVRYKQMHALGISKEPAISDSATKKDEKSRDQWWLKSNYVSMLNLPRTIEVLGPLVNLWDGGGKAERYIQEIKPHIPRGVRDGGKFFVRLTEKVYKLDAIGRIEEGHPFKNESELVDHDEVSSNESEAQSVSQASGNDNNQSIAGAPVAFVSTNDDSEDEVDSNIDEERPLTEEEERWSTPMEDAQMRKARTFYIYKNKRDLETSLDNHEPVSGIVLKSAVDGSPVMYVVYKAPNKSFGWSIATFNDKEGVEVCGLWYSPVTFKEDGSPPTSVEKIKKLAKMSSMAIPLRYTHGDHNNDSFKYCVITNWWRERNRRGYYVLPSLPFDFYADKPENST